MYAPYSWLKSLIPVVLYALLVVALGLYFDQLLLAISMGALLLLAINYWRLYRLNRWLWHSKKISPPRVRGMWEHIYEGIYHLQSRNRQKRKELGALVRRFREGSEALPDAAVVIDANANIVWCNRLARIELGLVWPDDAGRRIDNLIRQPDFVSFFQSLNFEQPIEVQAPTNPRKMLEYRLMPYGDAHLLLVARDVTRVSQLESLRKDFVANVSHELRTPLTVLNGYLEMLPSVEDMPEGFKQKAFAEMSAQTSRMQNLIEQLLVLSRIESSAERVFEKVVNVPQVLLAIRIEADSLNLQKSHQLIFEVELIQIYGIETELRSAFSNLIFNAIHYTPERGKIVIRWQKVEQGVTFSVIDNGEGIADKHLQRLTERFYRVDKARSRETGGSGLGLSIVKHVLNHHNSRLEISSQEGKGSEFSFTFDNELIADSDDL